MKNLKRCFVVLLAALVVFASMPAQSGVFSITAQAANKPALSAKKAVLGVGESLTLKLNNNKKKVKWSSSNKAVASVSQKGRVKALKAGKTKIIAKVGSKKYTCALTVKAAKLNYASAVLVEKSKLSLKLFGATQKVSFKTSNSKVASVSSKGLITAKKAGKATITAISGKKKYSCAIRVIKKPVLNVKEKEMLIGDSFALVLKNAVGQVKWSSDDSETVSVSSNGTIKALEDGDAEVTAEYLGRKYVCEVSVLCPEIDAGEEWLTVGETMQLKLLYNKQPVTWRSSDPEVLTVSKTGLAKGISEGSATVYASAGGHEYEVDIDVDAEEDEDWDDEDWDDEDTDDDGDWDDEDTDTGDTDDGDLDDGDEDQGDPDPEETEEEVPLQVMLGETYGALTSITLR